MQQGSGLEIFHRRRTGYHDHRDPLGEGSRHAIEGAQFPHAKGLGESADTPEPSVAVGGVGGIKFIAGPDIL